MYEMKLEMAHESSVGSIGGGGGGVSPVGAATADDAGDDSPQVPPPSTSPEPPDQILHQQILQLKKQQQLQQQILLQHFQQQQQQLAEQHEAQIRQHLKAVQQWEQQKALEEAAAAAAARAAAHRERERIDLLRKKDKHEHSAVASSEVKHKLQVFLMKKAAASANGTSAPYRNWGVVKSSSGESISAPASNAHPYRLAAPAQQTLLKYDAADFPLRKTASEPNMLKVRLKARVIERRASPMARRHNKRPLRTARNCGETGSPRGSPTAAPIHEEDEGGFPTPSAPLPPPDPLLYTSPSMPNISLGRPHAPPAPPAPPAPQPLNLHLPPVTEATPPAAHARHTKRLLGRTQSAPLPLGDPALASPAHHYLRQQIRKTVLTRAHDHALLREEEGEVIDLTDRRAKAEREEEERRAAAAAPLARALSSPLVGATTAALAGPRPTGLAYDALMLKHACACGQHAPHHPEHGGRLQSVWARLIETGLAARCERTRPRKASLEELQSVHTEAHALLFGTCALTRQKLDAARLAALPARQLVRLACGGVGVDSDTTWNELHTAAAARMAAGAVLDLAVRVAGGELANGMAVVRPPGHHAETQQAMGFCFFNSVAVAARLLHTRLRLQRILIVDWDVHHGNGTQQIFYEDPHVLYISIHRHDDGNFFPGTGGPTECGGGAGVGFNVNVAWSGGLNPPLADAEYMAAFRTIVMPIAKEYAPEMVLVSCGFDAASGHPAPLGGYDVSPACFAFMTRELMSLAGGKVVLALEGGYDLPAMCDCAQECVRALLGDALAPPSPLELDRAPHAHAHDTLLKTIAVQAQHWPVVKRYTACAGATARAAASLLRYGELQSERDAADTVSAMRALSVRRRAHTEPMDEDDAK